MVQKLNVEPLDVRKTVIEQEEQIIRPAENEHAPEVVSSTTTETRYDSAWSATGGRIIYFILGIAEAFLILRLILKLLAANIGNQFVNFIYNVSDILIVPFSGIFESSVETGVVTTSVFEPAVLVAIVVYALIGWGLVKLLMIFRRKNSV